MVAALAAVVVGLALGRDRLGVATPPFVADWAPRLHPLAAVSVVVLAAGCAAAPRLLDLRPGAFVIALWGLALALGLALNVARLGTDGWSAVFDLRRGGEAANEYLPGLPAIGYGVRFYLDRFAELVPSQPVNVAGHPPGPLLLVHALGIRSAGGLAALCIGAGSLTAPLTYALARALQPERAARIAALLVAFSPVVLLDGVTSFDYVFAALGTGAAALLIRGRAVSGGIALAVAALFSWALLGVAAWATLVVALRDGARAALPVAVGCAVAVAALDAALAGVWGYDPIGTLRATAAVYDHSIASMRPYWFWVAGSVVAWGVMLGPPIAAAALRGVVRRDAAAIALVAVLAVAAIAGFTKAETERIWLFLVPFACTAAAPLIARTRPILALLAAQALIVQALFATVW
jgi:methylthioxylose transferase